MMSTNSQKTTARELLQDITADISWFIFAKNYMGKSYSWFIKKFKGYDGNGQASQFSPEEREQLRQGLFDLSERIRKAAELL